MHFKVKARVLLELGAELISSDEIAIYELVKNGVDAGSNKIDLRIKVALTFTAYKTMQARLKNIGPRSLTEEDVESQLIPLLAVGVEDEITNEFRTILLQTSTSERLKKLRAFYCKHCYIEIEDWGHGMTVGEIDQRFLTIGTSHRASRTAAAGESRPLGEKGIGRLSCMRLGHRLAIRTIRNTEPNYAVLDVDWSVLVGDLDLDLDKFEVFAVSGEPKTTDKSQGTLVRIEDLQSDWTLDSVNRLIDKELAKLQNPFDRDLGRASRCHAAELDEDSVWVTNAIACNWSSNSIGRCCQRLGGHCCRPAVRSDSIPITDYRPRVN
jgi:hypothetical protein